VVAFLGGAGAPKVMGEDFSHRGSKARRMSKRTKTTSEYTEVEPPFLAAWAPFVWDIVLISLNFLAIVLF